MYHTMRRLFHWRHTANDDYAYAQKCESCCKHQRYQIHQRLLQLFPLSKPLEFIAPDMLQPLSGAKTGIRYIGIVPDRSSELTQAVSTKQTTVARVWSILFDALVMP